MKPASSDTGWNQRKPLRSVLRPFQDFQYINRCNLYLRMNPEMSFKMTSQLLTSEGILCTFYKSCRLSLCKGLINDTAHIFLSLFLPSIIQKYPFQNLVVEIGLRWLPKLGMDTSPRPQAHRHACEYQKCSSSTLVLGTQWKTVFYARDIFAV